MTVLAAGGLRWYALSPVKLRTDPADFSIRPGSSLRSATRQMIESGVELNAWEFNLLGRVLGKASTIKAGSYQVGSGITALALLDKLSAGDVTQVEIVFIEGWTFKQMRAALDADADVKHDSVALNDAEIMARLGAPGRDPEGLFFPDTYLFAKGSSDLAILKRAYTEMQRRLKAAWQRRATDLPYRDPYDALIMASVVEKETGKASDRAKIAGVFVNRLRLGMKLQTDPSVIYGLGDKFDGRLRKKDLLTDTPENTYTRTGLPPTPIAMPGEASLVAALHPAKTTALYFVARGDGSTEFSQTLAEHERAVAKYQRRGH
jgi:peptidoglycan lytic transglycosylase G